MGTFDSFADSPFQIRTEGQDITIIFARTGATTGRISWNIPAPALGCSFETQAYNGIVITLDTTHTAVEKQPVDGTLYTADPTGDVNLHVGDKIDTSLVVGAFYNDKTTVYLDVTGLTEDVPVFVSGFAVDKVNRYHTKGVHAYALDYLGDNGTEATPGNQTVTLGVEAADPTGLITGSPAETYYFSILIDDTTYDLEIAGPDAATYTDLVTAINLELSKLTDAPESLLPPNTGSYFWNPTEQKLYQWDGDSHVEQTVIVEATAPNTPIIGDYWHDPSTGILYKWSGSWVVQTYISYLRDPTALTGSDYWFDGTNGHVWEGNTWCQNPTSIQTTDPSFPVLPTLGTYWYDTVNLFLNQWNDQTSSWDLTDAIYWDVDPNALVAGTYWFDETNNLLKQRNGGAWITLAAEITATEPPFPTPNSYWYNPDTEELKIRDPGNTSWIDLTLIVFADDPADRESCNLWWNSTLDLLYVWDITTTTWDLVDGFLQQGTDPAAAPATNIDDMWYHSTDMTLSRWDGSMWRLVTFIDYPTDPTLIVADDVWFDTINSIWYEFVGSPLAWSAFDPTDAIAAPDSPALGTLWYDTTNNILFEWSGSPATFLSIPFTTMPLTPAVGELWFDTTTNILKEWSGNQWVAATPPATAILSEAGDIVITSGTTGANSGISITVEADILWTFLTPPGVVEEYVLGGDGINPEPMYQQVGVGDDGSPDERRELMDSIRAQLGYPVVDVELTKYQLDTAVTAGIESLRKRSSAAYHRVFFFVDMPAGEQAILLTDKTVGFNKVVQVMGAYRVTSSFLSTAFGSGVYGQIALQHLYTMGTFDLLSFHLVSEYIETMEMLFASRLTYNWNEHSRILAFYQTFGGSQSIDGTGEPGIAERVLLDCTIERTEQELLVDRFTKGWIEKYASSQARMMLSEIRGKYASLPGAGGGVSLNAAELMAKAEADMLDCYQQLDDMIVNPVEDYGIATAFVIG